MLALQDQRQKVFLFNIKFVSSLGVYPSSSSYLASSIQLTEKNKTVIGQRVNPASDA